MIEGKNVLVVSAHAADFVWRCGGAIAKYIKHGANVHLVVLSYGARGESGALWKMDGQTEEKVKQIRHAEIEKAAGHLDVKNLEILDYQDYHMHIDEQRMERLVRTMRQVRPDFILTHPKNDVLNPDHNTVSKFVFEASVLATSSGVRMDGLPHIRQPQLFGFEPHQTEISDYRPDTLIDITDVYEQKKLAMECFGAQPHLIDYYKDRAKMRGNHARRISGNQSYKYAESFVRFYPYVGDEFL